MRSNSVRTLVATVLATTISVSAAEAANECGATVKLQTSQRSAKDSPNWKFTFSVVTTCDTSTGSFEYSYKLKGTTAKPTTKRAPDWTASDKKTFLVIDEQSVGTTAEPDTIAIDKASIASKKL